MPVDPDDPVLIAAREHRLSAFLRHALRHIVGEALTYIGRALNIIEFGFGDDIPVPTSRKPDRQLPPHILHCQCLVEIDGNEVDAEDIGKHQSWLGSRPSPPICVALDADESGTLRMTLSGGHELTIQPDSDERIEHWRYFRPNDIESDLVLYEEA